MNNYRVRLADGFEVTVPIAAGMPREAVTNALSPRGTHVLVTWYEINGIGVGAVINLDTWPMWELRSPICREDFLDAAQGSLVDALALRRQH